MWILSYNRRLAWVAIPAVLWALIGLGLALGITAPAGEAGRAGLQLGVPEGGLRLRGHVVSVKESGGITRIVLAVPGPQAPPPPPQLPEDVQIEFVADHSQLRVRPTIELSDTSRLREFPGGRYAVVTERQILLFGHGEFRMLRRPLDVTEDRLYDWIERQHRRRGPPPGDEGPPPPQDRRPPPR